jgi:hypothetical protein
MGVQFKKKLTDGKMKHIAFILDCDGYASFIGLGERERADRYHLYIYWIEVVPKKLSL